MNYFLKFYSLVGLYIRTIQYLKIKQIYFRLRNYIYQSKVLSLVEYEVFTPQKIDCKFHFPNKAKTIIHENEFLFLNRLEVLSFPQDWSKESLPVLWLYNLHYFDGILDGKTSNILSHNLINKWIDDNPPGVGIGWQPYTLSLRICNWIKWIWKQDNSPSKLITSSLFQQTHYLSKTLEYHLLGNHLLENAKALIFSGVFFGGQKGNKWVLLGTKILRTELEEQILNDGGHFELSPMYHSIVLDLVLDILELCNYELVSNDLMDLKAFLIQIARKMSFWLSRMCHPDGEISYFNDSACGIAQLPEEILERSAKIAGFRKLKNHSKIEFMSDSGFIRLQDKDSLLLMDVGEVGASYLPGHGHADSLSIELSLFGQRVIVNLGTSEYGDTERRSFERSTAAHSTLELNAKNSSEVWGDFRVGHRASVSDISFEDNYSVAASHNGYSFLPGSPVHIRKVIVEKNFILIEDSVRGPYENARINYHLHPIIKLVQKSLTSGILILPNDKFIFWRAKASIAKIRNNYYASSFGKLEPTSSLVLIPQSDEACSLELTWE